MSVFCSSQAMFVDTEGFKNRVKASLILMAVFLGICHEAPPPPPAHQGPPTSAPSPATPAPALLDSPAQAQKAPHPWWAMQWDGVSVASLPLVRWLQAWGEGQPRGA